MTRIGQVTIINYVYIQLEIGLHANPQILQKARLVYSYVNKLLIKTITFIVVYRHAKTTASTAV